MPWEAYENVHGTDLRVHTKAVCNWDSDRQCYLQTHKLHRTEQNGP